MSTRNDGLIEIYKAYTTIIRGRPIVIHNVPMLQDPDTEETLITPETAERLYELLSHPENKTGVTTADLYDWENQNKEPILQL